MTHRRQPVIIYRDELLGESETFIQAQAESLLRFEAFYIGLRRRPGLRLPESRTRIISGETFGKVQRARFKLLGPSRRLRSMIARRSPALIHAHFGPDGCNALRLSEKLNLPLVVTLHGYDATVEDGEMPRLYVWRRNRLASHAAKFICVSKFIRDRAIAKGFPSEKLAVLYTGIDTRFFLPDASIERSPVILFVGRLTAKKGCHYLIRAAARVQQVRPDVELIVIGEGPLRDELEQQAASQLRAFTFLGAQQPQSVREWMNRAMVFCTPSVTAESGDAEGFGMVFAEAQAMGLPVVSFASGGVPEAVENGGTGFLVPERDWEALADKLLVLLQNDALRTQIGQAGRARVNRLFDLRKQTLLLEEIYDAMIAEWLRAGAKERQSSMPEFRDQHDLEMAAPLSQPDKCDIALTASREQ